MARGVLIFASNNEQIDYGLIALCNAQMIRHAMPGTAVALATDAGTLAWLRDSRGAALVDQAFDQVILTELPDGAPRRVRDTLSTEHLVEWRNTSRPTAYHLSPFEETILLDGDYLIQDASLALCWGSHHPVMMNRSMRLISHTETSPADQRVDPVGIPLYWATAMYFRRSPVAEMLFGLAEHVRENQHYYRYLYDLPGGLYRNDHAFSVAAHMLNGFHEQGDAIVPLPYPHLTTSLDRDELLDVPARGEMLFLVNDPVETWRFRPSRIKGLNVHVMNKFSIVRQADKILALYGAPA